MRTWIKILWDVIKYKGKMGAVWRAGAGTEATRAEVLLTKESTVQYEITIFASLHNCGASQVWSHVWEICLN